MLRGLNLHAESGKTTALVGASGQVNPLFSTCSRALWIRRPALSRSDGVVEVRDMSLDKLRDLFSVVTQEALLFDETLRENILLGRTDVTDAAAARGAGCSPCV